jgi:hypothetical protein
MKFFELIKQILRAFEEALLAPNVLFFVGWFALVLILACALLFVWDLIVKRTEAT